MFNTKKGFKSMKGFKRVTAVALSAAMILGSSVTAFAADPTTTAGTGNILDYKIVTDVVPTSLQVAINPNGYPVNLRYTKVASDADYSSTAKYYTKSDQGAYSVATDVTSENWTTKRSAGLYTATTSNSQIVSFNYGLANKSTVDRKITVKLDATADGKVEFVDSAEKAANQTNAEDTTGAKKGEYKVFLQLVPAKAGESVTASTYAKASGDFDQDGEYFTKSGTTYTEVASPDEDEFDDGDYYVATTTIGTEIAASELADVVMTDSTAPINFEAGKGSTHADVAYALGKATYTLKDDAFIDFNTATDGVESKFELTGIGGISAFTIKGSMNTNTEWSQLTTKTIKITPTYKFEDKDIVTAVSTGLNQVQADARSYVVTYNAGYGEDPDIVTESVVPGSHPEGTAEDIVALKTREGYTFAGWFTAKDDGEEVTLDNVSAATTVYAHWTRNPAAPSIEETEYVMTDDTAVEVDVDLGYGNKAATGIAAITYLSPSGTKKTVAADSYTFENGTLTFTAAYIGSLFDGSISSREFSVQFNDTAATVIKLTLAAE